MKRINKFLTMSAVALSLTALLPSCSMDEPFAASEGTLTISTEINGNVIKTRALEGEELARLRQNCVVYIENSRGVIRKYKGVDNIPEMIRLSTGNYVAEAWSGDSVSASFDAKFYRGKEEFTLDEGNNALTLKCNIANVVVSVKPESLDINLKNLTVTFSHSRGSLIFTETEINNGAKGYFMMPDADKDLSYKIEGTQADGSAYTKEGKIANVQRAHEYCMSLSEDPSPVTDGGAWIRLVIEDIPLIEETVEIFPAPSVRGVGFDNGEQVVSTSRNFQDTRVYIRGYYGLNSLIMNFSENFDGLQSGQNILEGSAISNLDSKGIKIEKRSSKDAAFDGSEIPVDEVYVTFTKAFLDALPSSANEYVVSFEGTDGNHKTGTGSVRFANDEAAVEHPDPVVAADIQSVLNNPMAILARRATLTGYVADASAVNYGIMYRAQGASEWIKEYPAGAARNIRTRADNVPFEVTLTNLAPGTTYEYKVFCDGFESKSVQRFSTEAIYAIPDASFEQWSTYSAKTLLGTKTITLPGSTGDKLTAYWGSGNEGSATANMTLTDKSSDLKHSGMYGARLESKSALGMLASGNIFVGYYVETDGTNGVLKLGREYNGSHPSKVAVWANYRPGSNVTIKSGSESLVEVTAGGTDQGQIYVALTDETIDIRTNPDNRKLFDADDPHVIAYGQVTWTEAFGPDGQLQKIEIPFTYNERAKSVRPTHLVITCAASKFGDYFSGAPGSVMYLDDFELVYE